MTTELFICTWKGVISAKPGDGQWTVDKEALTSWGIFDLAVSPNAPKRMFAGTRGDGVWVSDDLGETWRLPNRGKPGPGKVRGLAIDPNDPDKIYAGTEPIALWVSEDAGENWRKLDSIWDDIPGLAQMTYPGTVIEPHVRDVTIHPEDSNTIYASLQVGFMIKSTDGGATWKLLNKGVDADIHTIVLRDDDPDHIYVTTGGGDGRRGTAPGRALYESVDGGESWKPMAMEFELDYSVPITPHPTNPDILYSSLASSTPNRWKGREGGARAKLIRSENGGATWQTVETGFEEMHQDFPMAITFDHTEPDNIYVATRYGRVFGSTDGGQGWADLGIHVAEVTEMKAVTV
jgi:photosystem II stability/assembly factor-like uncharacterized protein